MNSLDGMAIPASSLVLAAAAVAFGTALWDAVRTDVIPAGGVPMGQLSPASGDSTTAVGAVSPEPGDTEDPESHRVAQGAIAESGAPLRAETWPAGGYPLVSQDEILEAVNQDLFQPDRVPPLERYRLPADRPDLGLAAGNDRRRREPNLRIVGTAIAGDLGIAMVQLEDSIPIVVVVGEEVDGYTLSAVMSESVTLMGPDGEYVFPVVEADLSRSSSSRGRNSRGENVRGDDVNQILQERVQQMLQQMGRGQMGRGGGLNPTIEIPGDAFRLQQLQRAGQLPPNATLRTRPGGGGGELP